jgi:hypothetical protein
MTMASELGASDAPLERCMDVCIDKIKRHEYRRLTEMLSKSKADDVYIRSPLYFAFTGRKGMLHFSINGLELIGCTHPNDDATLLLFMPFVYNEHALRTYVEALAYSLENRDQALFRFFRRFKSIHIARVPRTLIGLKEFDCRKIEKGSVSLEIAMEDRLDWAFPSYDICLSKSADPRGAELATYRNKVRKFERQGVSVVPFAELSCDKKSEIIYDISKRWVRNKRGNIDGIALASFNEEELLGPYSCLSNIVKRDEFPIDGIFLKKGSEYLAFWLWEDNGKRTDAVPCLAAVQASYEPGCAEYLHYQAARMLLHCGYRQMCIGGSESEALDTFKRKFRPVREHELYTLKFDMNRMAGTGRMEDDALLAFESAERRAAA